MFRRRGDKVTIQSANGVESRDWTVFDTRLGTGGTINHNQAQYRCRNDELIVVCGGNSEFDYSLSFASAALNSGTSLRCHSEQSGLPIRERQIMWQTLSPRSSGTS